MKCFALSTLACLVMATTDSQPGIAGGWSTANVDDVKKVYFDAVQQSKASANTTRLCATEFTSAQSQVVAGINYKLNVNACTVSSANETTASCKCPPSSTKPYVVSLFASLDGVSTISSIDNPLTTTVPPNNNVATSMKSAGTKSSSAPAMGLGLVAACLATAIVSIL
ncbi:hypothetical protein H257_17969 [Aphanomyces astaci]|uniref:Cystatin domain-containing protein n=1 Tax=Aphanomyces astaci TaxID=112090 RepID=W4FED6_APHAT|nr:hypothetical protein H257_17969 [Aphanomyces astaci]ETV65249.1 hypothetical protein H257_17969 [Aphanomyces astaci]|eukprot:XP_009845250.1 hypothetical protein H257_17969 [Aphanomyces astaci]